MLMLVLRPRLIFLRRVGEGRISPKRYQAIPDSRVRRDSSLAQPARMQRLFSMFPTGLRGLALLLLRASVAIALLYGIGGQWPTGTSTYVQAVAMALSVALGTGFLTPIAVVMALVLHVITWCTLGFGSVDLVIVTSLD